MTASGRAMVVADTREPDPTEMFTRIKNAIGLETYNLASLRIRTLATYGAVQLSQHPDVEDVLRQAWTKVLGAYNISEL